MTEPDTPRTDERIFLSLVDNSTKLWYNIEDDLVDVAE